MNIPFFTLSRQYHRLKEELDEAMTTVSAGGVFILGKNVAAFEQEFASFVGVRHAVGVASGTDALLLSLRALDIGRGDEVVIPANVYPTAFPVAMSGATIRLVDCRDDGLIDNERLAQAVTKRTRAIIPVHLYGNPVDMRLLDRIVKNTHRKIFVIEDAAQAHGTILKNSNFKMQNVKTKIQSSELRVQSSVLAGSVGDVGCFSFYPTKNIGAFGDAGIVVTGKKSLADRVRRLRMYGEVDRYISREVSGVSRLDELQAAFLRVKLRHVSELVNRRRAIARYYFRELRGVGDLRFIHDETRGDSREYRSSFHLFVIGTKHRERLRKHLANEGVGTAIHYPIPVHLTRAFRSLGYRSGMFPVSERLSREILSLPMYPELTDNEVATVVSEIKTFYHG